VLAGLDPAGLLELDGPLFDAVELAALERAAWLDELAASGLEVSYSHLAGFLRVHGAKGRMPPLNVERPLEQNGGPPRMSPAAFAADFGPKGPARG
jgi:hypothetical protein